MARAVSSKRISLAESTAWECAVFVSTSFWSDGEQAGVEASLGVPIANLEDVRARWVIGADGAASRVRRWAGLDTCARNSHRFSYPAALFDRAVDGLHGDPLGRGLPDLRNAGGAAAKSVWALISRTQELRVEDALRRILPSLSTSAWPGRRSPAANEGWLRQACVCAPVARDNIALVGDASGSVDAISGDGLCLSFKQAALLIDSMGRGDLARYRRLHPRLAIKPNFMTQTMLILDRGPKIRRWAFGALSAKPWNL